MSFQHISPKSSKNSFELMSNEATDMTIDHPHDDELRELVDRITPDNRYLEVDFGRPVGSVASRLTGRTSQQENNITQRC